MKIINCVRGSSITCGKKNFALNTENTFAIVIFYILGGFYVKVIKALRTSPFILVVAVAQQRLASGCEAYMYSNKGDTTL